MSSADQKPVADPHWVRDTMVEDYIATARRNGEDPSSADVERLALADIATYEAVVRDTKPRTARPKAAPVDPSPGARAVAADLGWEVKKRPTPAKRRRFAGFLDKPPAGPKQAAAIMRLGQILQPKSWFRPSRGFDYSLPRLAQKFTETMLELDRGAGEFEGKGREDCERIVWRVVEDLCDKSTGALGPWWVK